MLSTPQLSSSRKRCLRGIAPCTHTGRSLFGAYSQSIEYGACSRLANPVINGLWCVIVETYQYKILIQSNANELYEQRHVFFVIISIRDNSDSGGVEPTLTVKCAHIIKMWTGCSWSMGQYCQGCSYIGRDESIFYMFHTSVNNYILISLNHE